VSSRDVTDLTEKKTLFSAKHFLGTDTMFSVKKMYGTRESTVKFFFHCRGTNLVPLGTVGCVYMAADFTTEISK